MKKKQEILYESSPKEILHSLLTMPVWCHHLKNNGKKYQPLLEGLIERNFYKSNEQLNIKFIASDLNISYANIAKWLGEMYQDIFELNNEKPELFKQNGTKHMLYFRNNFDDYCYYAIWLNTTPRVHENFDWYFVKAKMGVSSFWVWDVTHEIESGEQVVHVHFKSGVLNRYREMLLQKALFENVIDFKDLIENYDYEIDRILHENYSKQIISYNSGKSVVPFWARNR